MKLMLCVAFASFLFGSALSYVLTSTSLSRLKVEHATLIAEQQQKARQLEQDLVTEKNEIQKRYAKELQLAKDVNSKLRNDLRTGRLRLSIVSPSCAMSTNTRIGIGKGRAELDAEVAERLVDIADQGDVAIRKLNYCIDRYNAARDALREQF